jgi:pimeloyl-ACP methyl ester carboxylesterase
VTEQMTTANDIEICAEAFGEPDDVPLLMIMGTGASMLLWEDEFCQRLAAAGRHVIRFDNRDTGRTTHFDFEAEPYSLLEMAADAAGVLDAYGLASAHVVGASMGGMIAQLLALDHRDRVRTITTIMSTPDPSSMTMIPDESSTFEPLPGPTEAVIADIMATMAIDFADRDSVIDARTAHFGLLAGSAYPYDEAGRRRLFEREFDRAIDFAHTNTQAIAVAMTPPWQNRLASLQVPTLVVHGNEDPLLQYPHGQRIAELIPGASLMTMPGVGHEMPRGIWDDLITRLIEHSQE